MSFVTLQSKGIKAVAIAQCMFKNEQTKQKNKHHASCVKSDYELKI